MDFTKFIVFFVFQLFFIGSGLNASGYKVGSLEETVKSIRFEEKRYALERLGYISANSFASSLIKKNHQIVRHDGDASFAKKFGFSCMNAVAVPLAFALDLVIGPINRDMIDSVHVAVNNPELPTSAKAKSVGLSIPYFIAGVPAGFLYRKIVSFPTLFSSGATYFGGSFNNFRRTTLILKALERGDHKSFWLGRLAKKVSAGTGVQLSREQVARTLLSALDNNSKTYKEFIKQLHDEASILQEKSSDKLGTLTLYPEVTVRAGVPIGFDQMAKLLKIAISHGLAKS